VLIQGFVLGKTFTVYSVVILLLIITSFSIASVANTNPLSNNAQGWLAVGFWAAAIAIFIVIKLFIWDYLDEQVENSKSEPFFSYYPVSLKHKHINELTLDQLQDL
jgi:cell division protein FtsW (lipid II flippase)